MFVSERLPRVPGIWSNQEMAKMMKVGLRVTRGSDWPGHEDDDWGPNGNGPGTVLNEHPTQKNVWLVKWDKTGITNGYWMGQSTYSLKIIDIPDIPQTAPKKTFSIGKKLLMAPSTFDLAIICENKKIECHKAVLCCVSNVFEAMFSHLETTEAQSSEVKIDDIQADTMKALLDFLYNGEVQEWEKINAALLRAAHKYNIRELLEYCSEYLKQNVSVENATDVLVSAHLADQKDLFDIVSKFAIENHGKLVNTTSWEEFKKTNPTMAIDIMSAVLKL